MIMNASSKETRHLDRMDLSRYGRHVEAIEPNIDLITEISRNFSADVMDAADLSTILSVFHHNPKTMVTFRNKASGELGGIALLPLNSAGHIALAEGTLNTAVPDLDGIARQSERAVSVYIWGINISSRTAGGIALAMKALNAPGLAGRTLYCKAANDSAYSLFKSIGFKDGALIAGQWHADLMAFERQQVTALATRTRASTPRYATFDASANDPTRVGIKVVHGVDELLQALAIRAASYLPEQDMPYEEDVDGNDLCSAHLVGYVGREPAATLRMRFFAGFAKLERLAVLPRFRGSSVAARIIYAGIDFGRDKGYERFYGQSEEAVFPIWKRAGFVPRRGPGLSYLTDRTYREGDLIVERSPRAITPYSGAETILRREGQWHVPGQFETARACAS